MTGWKYMRTILALTAIAVVSACQPPPPPRAAPVVPQYTPRAPTPPFGASTLTVVPPLRLDGLRETINRDLTPLEALWHVRAALNVAALSCTDLQYARLISDYNLFIKQSSKALKQANESTMQKIKKEIGPGYLVVHDQRQTQLYNYWSFSPLRQPFCDRALNVSQRAILATPSNVLDFAVQALNELEQPFTDFYLAYEQYQRDLRAWQLQYGQPSVAETVGYSQDGS